MPRSTPPRRSRGRSPDDVRESAFGGELYDRVALLFMACDDTGWVEIVLLYCALERVWAAPSVRVARLAATAHGILAGALPPGGPATPSLERVENELATVEADPTNYASIDASMTLADIACRTGRHAQAARRYRELAEVMPTEALRRFCLRRVAG